MKVLFDNFINSVSSFEFMWVRVNSSFSLGLEPMLSILCVFIRLFLLFIYLQLFVIAIIMLFSFLSSCFCSLSYLFGLFFFFLLLFILSCFISSFPFIFGHHLSSLLVLNQMWGCFSWWINFLIFHFTINNKRKAMD